MNTCPCCTDRLTQQFRHGSLSWFCRSCWSEMPNFKDELAAMIESPVPIAIKPLVHRINAQR